MPFDADRCELTEMGEIRREMEDILQKRAKRAASQSGPKINATSAEQAPWAEHDAQTAGFLQNSKTGRFLRFAARPPKSDSASKRGPRSVSVNNKY
jgi:hypothetical protein